VILIAHDLAPTDMLQLRERADSQFAGFVTELGGPTSAHCDSRAQPGTAGSGRRE